jgi:hypothetical protein
MGARFDSQPTNSFDLDSRRGKTHGNWQTLRAREPSWLTPKLADAKAEEIFLHCNSVALTARRTEQYHH